MPATHVHPLFALPFARLGLPATALTLGAMAPDVAYAIGAPWWGQHDPLGIFTFALPVGLLGLWLYEVLIAPALGFEATALAAVAAIAILSVGHGARVAAGFQGVLGVRVFLVRAVAGALVLMAGALVANGVWYRLTVARGAQPG